MTTIGTHWHGFDLLGWEIAGERRETLPPGSPFLDWELGWRQTAAGRRVPEIALFVGRWTVLIGHDGLTRAERKASQELAAHVEWITAQD